MAQDSASEVKRIIKEQLDVEEKDIKPESTFIEDLGADSPGRGLRRTLSRGRSPTRGSCSRARARPPGERRGLGSAARCAHGPGKRAADPAFTRAFGVTEALP